MSLIAIFSDLHLKNQMDAKNQAFVNLLRELRQKQVTDLWLLGDIFDLLTGPYTFWREIHSEIFHELETLARQGCRILWLEGNHDFHLKSLLTPLGIEMIDAEITREIGSQKIFLAHGDLVNPHDEAYLKWRAFTRDTRFRGLLSMTPEWIAKRFLLPMAESLSRKSRAKERDTEKTIQATYREYAAIQWKKGFSGVILGHCHVADFCTEKGHFYLNLGSWLDASLRYALWKPDSEPFPKVEMCRMMDK